VVIVGGRRVGAGRGGKPPLRHPAGSWLAARAMKTAAMPISTTRSSSTCGDERSAPAISTCRNAVDRLVTGRIRANRLKQRGQAALIGQKSHRQALRHDDDRYEWITCNSVRRRSTGRYQAIRTQAEDEDEQVCDQGLPAVSYAQADREGRMGPSAGIPRRPRRSEDYRHLQRREEAESRGWYPGRSRPD